MGVLKKTTGLMGLAVAPNPHHTLGALYGKILRTLKKMPENAAYRKYTEQIVRERAAVLQQTKDTYELESKINCGQAEELIIQAENELHLARKMLNWKPWEPLVSRPPKGQWDWPPAKA
ncbi:PREDICTED: NADH dehydrogenase [ubiquinone] 1 alpha subcomplex subunit 5 [Papilio xuthus]|uniref:NADH dehydrogenase n=1 Tax=Papilio xuthus TaxID=66420 RepID=I4DK45_PAPXU|nr:NADH dehydrogenase [ubiquinone] 1 alpha subcomplex subunit 5 [Papilio xuthus]KPI95059.1 NADH dehydrogenase [ubiquinone] 1 alpha subcomplex subunit 5 [Papilio xuthus]BAM18285.1 NADH dehydrogenase [Papilio xuthus]